MLTEEHIKNIKQPHKEPKKVELSVARAKAIAAELTNNSFENCLKELVEEQLEQHKKEIRKIRTLQFCEHKWHEFTKEEIYMYGSPRMYGIEDRDEEFIEAFYMNEFCYCDKCRMPYRFMTFNDDDFERIIEEYESKDTITLTAHNRCPDFLFEWQLEEKYKEEIKLLEVKIKSLKEKTTEDSPFEEEIKQLEEEINSLKDRRFKWSIFD